MGGRNLTLFERLRYRAPDWPEMARNGLFAFLRTVALFFRWAWLRLTGKTACRFAPMYETKALPDGSISQANGLYLPREWKQPDGTWWRPVADEEDWEVAIREQYAKYDKQ